MSPKTKNQDYRFTKHRDGRIGGTGFQPVIHTRQAESLSQQSGVSPRNNIINPPAICFIESAWLLDLLLGASRLLCRLPI
jgi:hypothetical protein